jgi:hypothetical protein
MPDAKSRENIFCLTDKLDRQTLLHRCNPIQTARPERQLLCDSGGEGRRRLITTPRR